MGVKKAGHWALALLVPVVCCLQAGCTWGPRQIHAGRLGYNQAIQQTQQEEMLLNLVRLKYREMIEVLSVGSVAAQYNWDGTAGLNGNLLESGANSLGINGSLRRGESPTIAYLPQESMEFNRALLSPLSIDTLALLARTGWAWDRIFRMTVQSMNGIDNATSAGGPTPTRKPDFESFRYVSQLLRSLQTRQAVEITKSRRVAAIPAPIAMDEVDERFALDAVERGYQFQQDEDGRWRLYQEQTYPSLVLSPDSLASPEVQELVQLLQLQPGRASYELKLARFGQIRGLYGDVLEEAEAGDALVLPSGGAGRSTITLSTRSLLETAFYLSQGIEVPEEHLRQGMVTLTLDDAGCPFDWTQMTGDLLRIQVARHRPQCAAVAAPFRGYWYYIDSRDLNSQSTFLLLMQLFKIETEAGGGSALPVLTLGI